jgi:hypothetical protein
LKHDIALGFSTATEKASRALTDLDRQVVASISCKHNLNIREFQKTFDSLVLPGTSGNFPRDSDACVNEVEQDPNGFIIVLPKSVEIFDNAISDSLWSSGLEFVSRSAETRPESHFTAGSQSCTLLKQAITRSIPTDGCSVIGRVKG